MGNKIMQAKTMKARKVDQEERRTMTVSEMIADGRCYERTGERHCLYNTRMNADCGQISVIHNVAGKHSVTFEDGHKRYFKDLGEARSVLNTDPGAVSLYNSQDQCRELPRTERHYFMFPTKSPESAAYVCFVGGFGYEYDVFIKDGQDVYTVTMPANKLEQYKGAFRQWRQAS